MGVTASTPGTAANFACRSFRMGMEENTKRSPPMYTSIQLRMSRSKAMVTARMLRIIATPIISAATVSAVRQRERSMLRLPSCPSRPYMRRTVARVKRSHKPTEAGMSNAPPNIMPSTAMLLMRLPNGSGMGSRKITMSEISMTAAPTRSPRWIAVVSSLLPRMRNASSGEMRPACHAGMTVANSVTIMPMPALVTSADAGMATSLTSCARKTSVTRINPRASKIPKPMPMAEPAMESVTASSRICFITCQRVMPSVRNMPISRVRSMTVIEKAL